MRSKLVLSSVVLSNLLTLETVGAGHKSQSMQRMDGVYQKYHEIVTANSRLPDQAKQNESDEFSQVNRYQIDFLRELQSNRTLCVDTKKISDPVEVAHAMAAKDSEARSFLERYAAYIRSCEGRNVSDIKKAVKEYAERSYAVLQEALSNPDKNGVVDIHIESQEFSVPGSTTRYPKFYGFVIR
ncbi:hypothetical protein [Candidatus Bodocaedibacter vickermanii]|uniref:Uncharacterized protein n=1 Tax=Candidatus Bodocaedibacter vickermanii TaxID=2741701 RepID=A0A7L9RT39_9PROT|nr:hypothetical protein CPBP_00456 [Candidatus Paracaedibacteraceae bacterium 'Lake Konstanz']